MFQKSYKLLLKGVPFPDNMLSVIDARGVILNALKMSCIIYLPCKFVHKKSEIIVMSSVSLYLTFMEITCVEFPQHPYQLKSLLISTGLC